MERHLPTVCAIFHQKKGAAKNRRWCVYWFCEAQDEDLPKGSKTMTAQINLEMVSKSLGLQIDELRSLLKFGNIGLNHENDGFVWNFFIELNKKCPKKILKKINELILVLPPDETCENYRIYLDCELDILTSICCLEYMENSA